MEHASTGNARVARRRTCDICRQRKAKCIVDDPQRTDVADIPEEELLHRPCQGCSRIGRKCTYDMGYKKPGRPSRWARNSPANGPDASSSRQPLHIDRNLTSSERTASRERNSAERCSRSSSRAAQQFDPFPHAMQVENPTEPISTRSTIHGLLTHSLEPYLVAAPVTQYPSLLVDKTISIDNLHMAQGSDGALSGPLRQADDMVAPSVEQAAPPSAMGLRGASSSEAALIGGPSYDSASLDGNPSLLNPFQRYLAESRKFSIQIEDVTSWSTVGIFLSLYLRYMHSLLPLVHKPTFTKALAMRQDRDDVEFRAFLLGLVAYTIGQSPMTRLQQFMQRPQLSRLQSDCHRASMLLLEKRYKEPSLVRIGGLITGYFYCASVGRSNEAGTLLAEACQLAHVMKLHDDGYTVSLNLNPCEVDLRRRYFWQLYADDITEASAGMPIHLQSYEGLPPYPLEVDDDFVTTQGYFDQPIGETSYMTGFKRCVSLFPIMAECLVRHRSLLHRQQPLTATERAAAFDWIQRAGDDVNNIIDSLPPVLRKFFPVESRDEEKSSVFGMQRANLLITAASVRFVLFDYKAAVEPTVGVAEERAAESWEALQTITRIPLNSLAANGESARGKVFRIILALIRHNDTPETWGDMNDWWNIYSNIQFVQLVNYNVESNLPSRACTPS